MFICKVSSNTSGGGFLLNQGCWEMWATHCAGVGHGWVLACVTMAQPQRNGIRSLNAHSAVPRPQEGRGAETVGNWLSLIPIHWLTSSLSTRFHLKQIESHKTYGTKNNWVDGRQRCRLWLRQLIVFWIMPSWHKPRVHGDTTSADCGGAGGGESKNSLSIY